MRFAITGCDRYLKVFEEFLCAGWEPVKFFTSPGGDMMSANIRMREVAEQCGIPVQNVRMSEDDLRDLRERGCDVLVVASYDWRIGNWPAYLKYAINFHPSPLPVGRGPYPLVRAILEDRRSWAITCHKIAEKFDTGDILATEPFAMNSQECHESLNLKLQMAAGRLAHRVAFDFEPLWNGAVPQTGGGYWPLYTRTERTVDFSMPVETILRQLRAFGMMQCYAFINDKPIYIKRAIAWTESHELSPNTVAHVSNPSVVIAARDGFVALLDWGALPAPEKIVQEMPATS